MARTFSHQRQRQHHKQPPLRAFYRTAPPDRHRRGPFADLADRVHERHQQATGNQPTAEHQKTQPDAPAAMQSDF